MYILASHGDYAKQTLKSCEMITGELTNFATVSFKDPMGIDDVVKCYEDIYQNRQDAAEEVAIIADIPNGTPANAANTFIAEHPDVKLYSGLSLMLTLSLATGTPAEEAISQTIELMESNIKKKPKKQSVAPNKETAPVSTGNPLVNVRIDSRLIHGQVATMWTRSLNTTRIMVVDDQIVTSKVQKATLKTAVPAGIHLSILTAKGAAKRINNGQYNGQRVLLLVKKPQILAQLVSAGVKLPAVNVGNMSMSQGARQVAKSVAVTDEDTAAFSQMAEKGIEFYHQMVPNDKQEPFISMLNKKEN
ncbi:PTS mannose/fructose/sorbose transporter subunit IIAB [Lactobacillus apis]|uniref:PTS mannose/fructose/sorbose transporter subunit IIAB n=1 Tax=Lactobacillus apis TaxID=303541 RepID=UPI00242CEB00|nr:PTS mannose/fructose/sorbose transporter subunit IIAB [Lactobacillus apis]